MANPYELAKERARLVSDGITAAANSTRQEADFRREVQRVVDKFSAEAGVVLRQHDERILASGRADTVYNRLVLEYKAPGKIVPGKERGRESKITTDAISQTVGYVRDVAKKERWEATRMAGVILDGRFFIFIRFSETSHVVDPIVPVSPESTERFLKYLVSLNAGSAVVPENLVQDFGPKQTRTRDVISALYSGLLSPPNGLVSKLFEQWKIFFTEVAGYEVETASFAKKDELRALAKSLGVRVDGLNPAALLYSLHTYYALLLKLIAWLSVSPQIGAGSESFGNLASMDRESLRKELENLESGGVFRKVAGIRNFLEGDFFSWYTACWDDATFAAIHQMVGRLAEYDAETLDLNPEETRDLLKKLYHYLLPRKVRHDLGEYYTPDWLAQFTVARASGALDPWTLDSVSSTSRFLDPACGSGTFLVLVINAMKSECRRTGVSGPETLKRIRENVVGIDLNPLAVIAARTNYLLAIRDLLQFREGEIDLPIYLADSVLTPVKTGEITSFGTYRLKTAAGVFEVPAQFSTQQTLELFTNLMDECVESDYPVESFLKRLEKGIEGDIDPTTRASLTDTYSRILALHQAGMNGIWSRIIKNAFAPLFIGRFDFVVGNPPWINWESLPDEYRLDTRPLWEKYGLFPHGGMDTILGKGKKDLSALMTLVALDKYLSKKGVLGFVITQTLFKTSGAAQGFRRFEVRKGVPFRPMVVDDMVALNPFEGATNRTAVMTLGVGKRVSYPSRYFTWKKSEPGSIPFDASVDFVSGAVQLYRAEAEPVDSEDDTSAWLTCPKGTSQAVRKTLGQSDYQAHEGVNTGGGNGVYWVTISGETPDGLLVAKNITKGAKRKVDEFEATVEADLVYPLIRGRDVGRWRYAPSASIILAQDPKLRRGIDEELMRVEFPKTYAWLKHFEPLLRERAILKRYYRRKLPGGKVVETGSFYSMFNVGEYSLAKWKAVWRYIANDMICAAVGPHSSGKPIIADHRLMAVSCRSREEAHYLSGVLNSSPARLGVMSYVVGTQISTHVLENVRVPLFSKSNGVHQEIAEISADAHGAVKDGNTDTLSKLEGRLDHKVAELWHLSRAELATIQAAVREWLPALDSDQADDDEGAPDEA